MTAALCVGCSGQCLYRSVVGCCHKKVSTATWQLFNFNGQSGRSLQIYLIRRIVKSLQTTANQSSESKCQKHGFTNSVRMFMVPCPEAPLTPRPLTPCPSPQETLKVCLHPINMMFHPVFMVPCPETPLTPRPLTPCPSPQETLKVCLHQINMMFHPMFMVPCPETPRPLTPCPSHQDACTHTS